MNPTTPNTLQFAFRLTEICFTMTETLVAMMMESAGPRDKVKIMVGGAPDAGSVSNLAKSFSR